MTNSRAVELRVPLDFMSDDHVILSEWHVDDGAMVSAESPVATLEGSKASVDVCAPCGGRVHRLAQQPFWSPGDSIALIKSEVSSEDGADQYVGEACYRWGRPSFKTVSHSPDQQRLSAALASHNRRALVSRSSTLVPLSQAEQAVASFENQMVTIPDLVVWHAVAALAKYPELNAGLFSSGLKQFDDVNLGYVVDTSGSMMVPVIRQANRLGLDEFLNSLRELVLSAARGELTAQQCRNGTFTVSNLFSQQVLSFDPVLNVDQSSALGIASPVGEHFSLVLAFDHRFVTGGRAAGFLSEVVRRLLRPA